MEFFLFLFNRILKKGGHILPPRVTSKNRPIIYSFIILNLINTYIFSYFFLSSEGPKPKTIADFWTMIWQEEVYNIVCLTNLTEGTKVNT